MKITKVGATLVEKDGKFLFVRSIGGGAAGLWNNPGGRVERGESFEEAALRETKEETGYDIVLSGLILTSSSNRGDYIVCKKIYLAKIVGGDLCAPAEEIKEAKWFGCDEINSLNDATFGCVQSVRDFLNNKFNQEYDISVIS